MPAASRGDSPYRLFALSNLASLLALASYPLLIEPRLTMNQQTGWWSGGFLLFAVLCGAIAWQGRRRVFLAHAAETGGLVRPPGGLLVFAGPGRRHDADRGDQPHEREHRRHSPVVAAAAGAVSADVHPGLSGGLAAGTPVDAAVGAGGGGLHGLHAAGYSQPSCRSWSACRCS